MKLRDLYIQQMIIKAEKQGVKIDRENPIKETFSINGKTIFYFNTLPHEIGFKALFNETEKELNREISA